MSWSGYRPSDDPQVYSYNIPVNMYAAGALEKVLVLNERIWQSSSIADQARQLVRDIQEGIEKFGIVDIGDGTRIYAYEV
jgi:meiotically up-regulated gene 157 (Mug157) protein